MRTEIEVEEEEEEEEEKGYQRRVRKNGDDDILR